MAKIPSAYVQYATLVAYRKGRVAKIARWLHRRVKSRFLHNLGYEAIEILNEPQVIGVVVNDAEKGKALQIKLPTATFSGSVEVYPHRYNEN